MHQIHVHKTASSEHVKETEQEDHNGRNDRKGSAGAYSGAVATCG